MPTDAEEKILKQFCKVCDEILECRFVRSVKEQGNFLTICENPDDNRIPHYDSDDFRSFATLFRKLIAEREPSRLFRVMNILIRYAPADKKCTFKEVKTALHWELVSPPFILSIGTDNSEQEYTPERITRVFFNGLIFHSDQELQDDLAKLLEYEPFAMLSFLRYACMVVNVSIRYSAHIKRFKFFREMTPIPAEQEKRMV